MRDEISIAESSEYRRKSGLERVGTAIGRALARAPLRGPMKAAFHRLLEIGGGGRGLTCTLPGGETVRVLPAYRYISWNRDEYDAFVASLGDGDVALDVGANVGAYSLVFGRRVGPSGRVFAFEPSPDTFAGLSRHIEINGLGGVVTPVQAAASDTTGVAEFRLETEGMSRLAASGEAPAPRVLEVPTVTIDEFCARERITPRLIKIDVEGAELAVLRGARETIRAAGAKIALYVELHPTTWRAMGISKDDLLEELEGQGLRAEPLREVEDLWSVEGECVRLVRR